MLTAEPRLATQGFLPACALKKRWQHNRPMRGSFSVYLLPPVLGLVNQHAGASPRQVFYSATGEQKQSKSSYFIRFIFNGLRAPI
jgi:hypothetical protein